MAERDWEVRLGLRLDSLENADPVARARIHQALLAHEDQLDDSARAVCERLLPLLNVKSRREMSDLIARRWPDSPHAQKAVSPRERAEHVAATESALIARADATRSGDARYWLRVAGTGEEPHERRDWSTRHVAWARRYGEVAMFPRRPSMSGGDRFVVYAAGSHQTFGEGRIYMLEEIVSPEPLESPHERWPWMVRTRPLIPGPMLHLCPTILDIGVDRSSLRRQSYIGLSEEQGRRAEVVLARAAAAHGSLLKDSG
jgi:hypothetical protein